MAADLEPPTFSRAHGDLDGGEGWEGDEAGAAPPAARPLVVLSPSFEAAHGGSPAVGTLVVAVGPCACAAASLAAADRLREAGTLLLPDVPLSAFGFATALDAVAAGAATCSVFELLPRGGGGGGAPPDVVVLAQQHVAPERAFDWAAALCGTFRAARTVVLDAMPAGSYQPPSHGGGVAPLLRRVVSAAAAGSPAAAGGLGEAEAVLARIEALIRGGVAGAPKPAAAACPDLEQPNLVAPHPAAIMAECQVEGRACEVYLSLLCPLEDAECAAAFAPALEAAGMSPPRGVGEYARAVEAASRGASERGTGPSAASASNLFI